MPEHYLFIITRDLGGDSSAQYVLRRALGLRERGADVTIVLRDQAVTGLTDLPDLVLGARLLQSDIMLLVHRTGDPTANDALGPPDSCSFPTRIIDDEELANLLLDDGIEAHWC